MTATFLFGMTKFLFISYFSKSDRYSKAGKGCNNSIKNSNRNAAYNARRKNSHLVAGKCKDDFIKWSGLNIQTEGKITYYSRNNRTRQSRTNRRTQNVKKCNVHAFFQIFSSYK